MWFHLIFGKLLGGCLGPKREKVLSVETAKTCFYFKLWDLRRLLMTCLWQVHRRRYKVMINTSVASLENINLRSDMKPFHIVIGGGEKQNNHRNWTSFSEQVKMLLLKSRHVPQVTVCPGRSSQLRAETLMWEGFTSQHIKPLFYWKTRRNAEIPLGTIILQTDCLDFSYTF